MATDDKPTDEEVVIPEENVEEASEQVDTPSEEVQEQPAEEEAPAEETEEEEPRPPSRREQLRVQDLLTKYGPPSEQAPSQNKPDFRTKVDADEEVYKTLDQTTQEYGQNQYDAGIERAKYYKWETLLQVDEPQVQARFPQLDPRNKDEFHETLNNALQAKYARFVGYNPGNPEQGVPRTVANPDIRYLDFVESELEYAQELASHLAEKTQKNIAKQAANTGLRPDGSSAKKLNLNKAAEDMSDEELKAKLASFGM